MGSYYCFRQFGVWVVITELIEKTITYIYYVLFHFSPVGNAAKFSRIIQTLKIIVVQ